MCLSQGVVNENMCNVVQAPINVYLDSRVEKDIKMYINSGGGSVIMDLVWLML
jgi:ATP-dependent protease ClpP protease subunit